MPSLSVTEICRAARAAARKLAAASGAARAAFLAGLARGLEAGAGAILAENQKDVKAARAAGRSPAFLDRLALDEKRLAGLARGVGEVAALPDPLGEVLETVRRADGLVIEKVRVPIGVVALIYESRPTVTIEAAALCLKAGNACVLRGGRESARSNRALHAALQGALEKAGLPAGAAGLVAGGGRAEVGELLRQREFLDLVIPRGGEDLVRRVVEESRIPVIKHYKGVCHAFVDEGADLDLAEKVCLNAKVQRPGTCNALECLLVHRAEAPGFLPRLAQAMARHEVELRGCPESRRLVPGMKPAAPSDWGAEFLDLVLAVKVVGSLAEAVEHIARFGSGHSDAILTRDKGRAEEFARLVDSAAVFINCSTRLHDGGQFGMGAEIGISTDKLHARGPMALPELTSYTYIVYGDGQVRE